MPNLRADAFEQLGRMPSAKREGGLPTREGGLPTLGQWPFLCYGDLAKVLQLFYSGQMLRTYYREGVEKVRGLLSRAPTGGRKALVTQEVLRSLIIRVSKPARIVPGIAPKGTEASLVA